MEVRENACWLAFPRQLSTVIGDGSRVGKRTGLRTQTGYLALPGGGNLRSNVYLTVFQM
jgi:hypothetical protein